MRAIAIIAILVGGLLPHCHKEHTRNAEAPGQAPREDAGSTAMRLGDDAGIGPSSTDGGDVADGASGASAASLNPAPDCERSDEVVEYPAQVASAGNGGFDADCWEWGHSSATGKSMPKSRASPPTGASSGSTAGEPAAMIGCSRSQSIRMEES